MGRQRGMRRAIAVVVCVLFGTGMAWANGEEFFGSKDDVLDMYYFGSIKDGRVVVAVGVGGSAPATDEQIALAGANAIK